MKNKIKQFVSYMLAVLLFLGQTGAFASVGPAVIRTQLAQQGLGNILLPGFRYSRYDIELNTRTGLDLIVEPTSKIVKVEVTSAEGTGLGIDNTTLLMSGIKIFRAVDLRPDSNGLNRATPKNKVITFDLSKLQDQIIQGDDFKIFKVFVRGLLPGSYVLKATVDNGKSATTTVFTKPDFRLDGLTPASINPGTQTTLTFIGKGFDAFTGVSFGSSDVEVRGTQALDTNTLKVVVFAGDMASPGYRDVTISGLVGPNAGKLSTLGNGFLVNGANQSLATDSIFINSIINSLDIMNGMDGLNGVSICDDSTAMVMVFANNLGAGAQATVFLDPVQCNITFGIPVGFNGVNAGNGSDGMAGASGLNCWDLNGNGVGDVATEDTNSDTVVDINDCQGIDGADGINCWDLNANGTGDNDEDFNGDGEFSASDCQGLPTVEEVISNWEAVSEEQDYTTAGDVMARMVKVPRFVDVLNDGVVYGGFWVDKYEASRSDASNTAEGVSSNIGSKRSVIPYTNINLATAQTAASGSGRQISGLGSCRLVGMREWESLNVLGRYSKVSGKFSADTTNGWDERGNTRNGNRDGRNSSSFTCTDDPTQSGTGDRCLTGTGYKSWGHLLDGSAQTNTKAGSGAGQGALGASADSTKDDGGGTGADTFDGDLQVYDLVGNVQEFIDFTVTRTSTGGGTWTIDSGFSGAGRKLPFTSDNQTFNFDDLSQDPSLQGLGLPVDNGSATDSNGGKNSGVLDTASTNQTYSIARGGSYTTDDSDAASPLTLDISSNTTSTSANRGFRVVCDLLPDDD